MKTFKQFISEVVQKMSSMKEYGDKSEDPTNFLRNKEKEKIEFKKISQSGDLDQRALEERIKNLELLEQDLTRQKRLAPDLVSKLATAKAKGYNLWLLPLPTNSPSQGQDVFDELDLAQEVLCCDIFPKPGFNQRAQPLFLFEIPI